MLTNTQIQIVRGDNHVKKSSCFDNWAQSRCCKAEKAESGYIAQVAQLPIIVLQDRRLAAVVPLVVGTREWTVHYKNHLASTVIIIPSRFHNQHRPWQESNPPSLPPPGKALRAQQQHCNILPCFPSTTHTHNYTLHADNSTPTSRHHQARTKDHTQLVKGSPPTHIINHTLHLHTYHKVQPIAA